MSDAASSLVTLEALYDAYHRQALGIAYKLLGSREEAEEVVQEAFLSAWRSSQRYDHEKGSTRTWFLSLVRNRCIDAMRARGRRPVAVPVLYGALEPADAADVASHVATAVDGERAREALASLPDEQQTVIELAYFHGLSHAEIAQRMDAPVGTVKSRIRLALDRLRVRLVGPAQPDRVSV